MVRDNILKWTGGVGQVVECLLCKQEALSSNPSSSKKHTNKQQQPNKQKIPRLIFKITLENAKAE
jgi:hypothetical protein